MLRYQEIQRRLPQSEIPAYMEVRPRDPYHQTGEGPGTAVILSSHKSTGHDWHII